MIKLTVTVARRHGRVYSSPVANVRMGTALYCVAHAGSQSMLHSLRRVMKKNHSLQLVSGQFESSGMANETTLPPCITMVCIARINNHVRVHDV